jgi:hypothetical protein
MADNDCMYNPTKEKRNRIYYYYYYYYYLTLSLFAEVHKQTMIFRLSYDNTWTKNIELIYHIFCHGRTQFDSSKIKKALFG